MITRRRFVGTLAASVGGVLVAGCDKLDRSQGF